MSPGSKKNRSSQDEGLGSEIGSLRGVARGKILIPRSPAGGRERMMTPPPLRAIG